MDIYMKSMTAFGRGEEMAGGREIRVEIKSVNNRFLDLSIRLPRAYASLEERVKAALRDAGVNRGKVDVNISVAYAAKVGTDADVPTSWVLNSACAKQYAEAATVLAETLSLPNDLTVSRLLRLPGVMVEVKEEAASLTEEDAWALISPALGQALDSFLSARGREGERLGADILLKIAGIRPMVAFIAAHSEENIRAFHDKFEERLRALIGSAGVVLDENRILTECALYADRVAIDEELVRLSSHLDTLEALCQANEPVGRKIDFMLQETNREINTIGSKCADTSIARTVADVKSELEKIREQVQNIE